MRVPDSHLKAQEGLALVERAFTSDLKWLFRPQPTSDLGVDAHVEVVTDGNATGRLLAVQVKSGASYFREENSSGFVYRDDRAHLEYWLNHSLPVIIVILDPASDIILWEIVSESKITRTGKGWRLTIPRSQRLGRANASLLQELAEGPRSFQHVRELQKNNPWKEELRYYPTHLPPIESLSEYPSPLARTRDGLEVVVSFDREMDYIALLPAFSTTDPEKTADLTVLTAGLSAIEVINHDAGPTEVLRLWLVIEDEDGRRDLSPLEIKEEEVIGARRIDPRNRQKYDLEFTAVFEGTPQEAWRDNVHLCIKTIGLGELRIGLKSLFFEQLAASTQ